jgi:hypothetical protein
MLALSFSTIADSAVNTLQSAVSGVGPAVVGIVGLIAGVGLVIKLLHKASR